MSSKTIIDRGLKLHHYVSNDINITRLKEIEPVDSEIMCLEFQLPNKLNIGAHWKNTNYTLGISSCGWP